MQFRKGDLVKVYYNERWESGKVLDTWKGRDSNFAEVAVNGRHRTREFDVRDIKFRESSSGNRRSRSSGSAVRRRGGASSRKGRHEDWDDWHVVKSDSDVHTSTARLSGRRSKSGRVRRSVRRSGSSSPRSSYIEKNKQFGTEWWRKDQESRSRNRYGSRSPPRRRGQSAYTSRDRKYDNNGVSTRARTLERQRLERMREIELEDELIDLVKKLDRMDLVDLVEQARGLTKRDRRQNAQRSRSSMYDA